MTFHQTDPFLRLLSVLILVVTSLYITEKSFCALPDQPKDLLQVVTNLMVSHGFENIRASMLSDTLVIEYENRVYLRERDAISVMIPEIMNAVSSIKILNLISKRDNVPLLLITISRDDYQKSIATKQNVLDMLKISPIIASPINKEKLYNSSSRKVDIILHPYADVILGRLTDPFIPQYAVSPEISVYCGKGIKSIVRLKTILYDEQKKSNRLISLDGLYIDYTYRFGALKSIDLSAGYFGMNRYGINSDTTLFIWHDIIGIGCSVAYLGNMYYRDNTIYLTKLWNWTAFADLYYRLPFWNMLLTARLGRFLYQDSGVSGEIIRFYKNVSIGVFLTKTDRGSTFGLRLQFLPYPRRNMKPNYVRIKLPDVIKAEYRYKYKENIVGTRFSPKYNNVGDLTDTFWLMNFKD